MIDDRHDAQGSLDERERGDGERDERERGEREAQAPDAPGTHDETTRGEAGAADAPASAPDEEVDVLRRELGRVREALEAARIENEELKERALRARADLENARRRAGGELDRARDAGLDAALLPVLTVYDDLGRALQAAESGDPAAIVPGVRAVRETLERKLAALGVERIGDVGDAFDPDRHEALTAVPTQGDAQPGTIADVFEAGFVRNARLIRPARVVVYEDDRG